MDNGESIPHDRLVIRLGNKSKKPFFFNAEDGRLYMKMQALDRQGEWRDIEFVAYMCRYSHHTIKLNSGTCWTFTVPRYEGDFKTKLRMEVRYINPKRARGEKRKHSESELVLFSPEFEGSVNQGQFWRSAPYIQYTRTGTIVPYSY